MKGVFSIVFIITDKELLRYNDVESGSAVEAVHIVRTTSLDWLVCYMFGYHRQKNLKFCLLCKGILVCFILICCEDNHVDNYCVYVCVCVCVCVVDIFY